jgi:hypothetical protein
MSIVGIVHLLDFSNVVLVQVHQYKVRTASKMRTDYAVQTMPIVGRNSNAHRSIPLFRDPRWGPENQPPNPHQSGAGFA